MTGINDLIIACRKQYLESQGLTQKPNFTGSKNGSKIIKLLLDELLTTNKNEFTYPIDTLAKVLKTDNLHVSTMMNRYFKNYGIGEFVSTGKSRYNIFKVLDKHGKEIKNKIRPESHYTFYFSKTFIELLREKNIGNGVLNYNKLIKEADETAKLLEQIANKRSTTVTIHQYIDKNVSIDTYINIERDYLSSQGTFTEETYLTMKDAHNNIITEDCVKSRTNTFVPRK